MVEKGDFCAMKQICDGNDTARKIYKESVGEEVDIDSKGVQMYERPYLWRDDTPCSHKDTPTENFIPTPILNTIDVPKWRRVLCAVLAATAVVGVTIWWLVGVLY